MRTDRDVAGGVGGEVGSSPSVDPVKSGGEGGVPTARGVGNNGRRRGKGGGIDASWSRHFFSNDDDDGKKKLLNLGFCKGRGLKTAEAGASAIPSEEGGRWICLRRETHLLRPDPMPESPR